MKEFVITLLGALVVSCIFNSIATWMGLFPNLPPYPYGVSIGEVKESAFGSKREESSMPELNFTTGVRPTMYIKEITEGDRTNAEFPLGANN